jgi:ketosteroid isomerase-like protein
MRSRQRPFADRLEVGTPRLAALGARTVGRLPGSVRQRVFQSAFDRARDAFNRGDLEVVFALFAPDVEYVPPPPLHQGGPLRGRAAVFDFWRGVLAHYDDSAIENLSLEAPTPGCIVRKARLRHRSSTTGAALDYVILQTTELVGGRVARQVNVLDLEADPDTGGPAPEVELILRSAYHAFNAHDVEAALELMHPEVDWPNAWEGGRVIGRTAVRDYWNRQFASISSKLEPLRFIEESDGTITVDVHQVVRDAHTGELLSSSSVRHCYQLEDGSIVRMDVLEPNAQP